MQFDTRTDAHVLKIFREGFMKFYHGTSKENWNKILNEGVLWGYNMYKNSDGTEYMGYRYTYLTPCLEIACKYGKVILEIEYEPVGINGKAIDNYCFEHEIPEEERKKGAICWQFSVFIPIDLKNVKRLYFFNVRWKKFLKCLHKLNTKLHSKHWLYTVLANRFNVL